METPASTSLPAKLASPALPLAGTRTELAGWGANHRVHCQLIEPDTLEQLRVSLDRAGSVARGLGRSYGDAAVNAGRQVVGTRRLNRILAFDETSGVMVCEAGVSLGQIIAEVGPRGWFPMITPGTKFVTVGGCIANDVHGKAHHAQGAFSVCVQEMSVLLANGEVVVTSRTALPDLFWGSFGGMGLLGVVLTATLQLRRIETTYFRQKLIQVNDLDAMISALDEHNSTSPYSVANLDIMATGASLGRGVLVVADHARLDELPPSLAKNPLKLSRPEPVFGVPFELPQITLNPLSIRLVNAVIMAILTRPAEFAHYEGFFYPLDMLAHWNRGYGRAGFTQYQFVVPLENGLARMREILDAILSSGDLPFLNVLKRLGKESDGVLSFLKEGYTFAIDFPIRANTAALVRRLDRMVLDAGGRIYLGKDAFVEPEMFRAMYPAIDEWLAIKAKYDPDGVFTSDLGRRVGLSR